MFKIFITLMVLTFSEVYLMTIVAKEIGFMELVGIVLLISALGIFIAKKQGLSHLKNIQQELVSGKLPDNALVEGFLILFAAIILIIPGFITDVVGFSLLLPPIRRFVARRLSKKFAFKGGAHTFTATSATANFSKDDFFDMPSDVTQSTEERPQLTNKPKT